MANRLGHKGYFGSVDLSALDHVFYGQVVGIKDLVSYEGNSMDGLKKAFVAGLEDHLQHCGDHQGKP